MCYVGDLGVFIVLPLRVPSQGCPFLFKDPSFRTPSHFSVRCLPESLFHSLRRRSSLTYDEHCPEHLTIQDFTPGHVRTLLIGDRHTGIYSGSFPAPQTITRTITQPAEVFDILRSGVEPSTSRNIRTECRKSDFLVGSGT